MKKRRKEKEKEKADEQKKRVKEGTSDIIKGTSFSMCSAIFNEVPSIHNVS